MKFKSHLTPIASTVIACILLFGSSAVNAGWEELEDALFDDDPKLALKEAKACASSDARCQYILGMLHEDGRGTPVNFKAAAVWYRKAAEQGYPPAQYFLGLSYANGRGVPKDEGQAVAWYRKAAEQGYAKAQFDLGVSYDKGQGVPKNEVEALGWYTKAADQGHAGALYSLAVRWANGRGPSKDDDQVGAKNLVVAYALCHIAAEKGHEAAKTNLPMFATPMSRHDLRKAEDLSMRLLRSESVIADLNAYLRANPSPQ